tara:strand:+ start:2690 stop:3220 length:531 start_codon:yes stop_codon:yes gene_type:complete
MIKDIDIFNQFLDDNISKIFPIISPISKNKKSKGLKDYNEQIFRYKNGETIMWDDAKNNPTKKPGGLFGFVHNGKRVEIHIITNIYNPIERLSSWSDNVGQSDRNVLILTKKLIEINWKQWVNLGCPKKVQGTTRVVTAKKKLTSYCLKELEKKYIELTSKKYLNNLEHNKNEILV